MDYYISDPHYDHENILTFEHSDGTPVRDFKSLEEMQQVMIERHNSTVQPIDKVYYLGDVVMNKKNLKFLERLNGRKTLIAGNHDVFNTDLYKKHFENIRAYKIVKIPKEFQQVDDGRKDRIIMSHIPVHPAQLEHRFKYNVHGHLHRNLVHDIKHPDVVDTRYINICVEHTDYTPLTLDEILIKHGLRRST